MEYGRCIPKILLTYFNNIKEEQYIRYDKSLSNEKKMEISNSYNE